MESLNKIIKSRLAELYGNDVPSCVKGRVKEELSYFKSKNYIPFLEYLYYFFNKLRTELGVDYNAYHSRQVTAYSFVLYLLRINDVNPLKPFENGHNLYNNYKSGFDLDFELFKLRFENQKETLSLSFCKESKDIVIDNRVCHLVYNKLTELTFANHYVIPQCFEYTDSSYCEYLLFKDSEPCVLVDKCTLNLLDYYGFNESNFLEISKAIALSYGQNVIEANKKIGRNHLKHSDMIVSLDDLYSYLISVVDNEIALEVCRYANSKEKIPAERTKHLLKCGVPEELIDFANTSNYLFTMGGAFSIAKSIVKLSHVMTLDNDAAKTIVLRLTNNK